MTYDPTVPQANQFISTSQPIIQANFNKLNVDFGVDHNPNTTPLLNGNGEHKKITFTNVGTPPYPINGTKSYEYSNFIDTTPGTLTYVQYQSAGTDVISGLAPVAPMSPRALLYGITTALPPVTINRSFNIASATVTGIFPNTPINIVFQENLSDLNYIVFAMIEGSSAVMAVSNKALSGFTLSSGFFPPGVPFAVMVF